MRRLVAIALLGLSLAVAGDAAAAPRAELSDIEDEVMCPVCGTPLALSESPSADRERAFIQRRIDEGKSKEQIKRALVAEFGEEVLAMPSGRGFSLTAYVVPAAVLLIAFGSLFTTVRRRRETVVPPPDPAGDTFDELVDADLAGPAARH